MVLTVRANPVPVADAPDPSEAAGRVVGEVLADLDRGSYKSGYLVWTSMLDASLRRQLESSPASRRVVGFETIPLNFYPRESHLITFRDPWSFPVLYHPACNNLVTEHMRILAQKVRPLSPSMRRNSAIANTQD